MTTLHQLPRTDPKDNGGIPARRAVVRWAWRLFRRQWRSQVLVLALLTLAVAAAVGGAAAAFNLAPAAGNAVFGAANHSLEFEEPDGRAIEADVKAAVNWFGTVDVIERTFGPVPGLFDPMEMRAQDPFGPFSAPMLALVDGRYPTSTGEAAVTDGVARILKVDLGASFDLGDTRWTVVGLIENPSDLNDDFVLISPSGTSAPESVTILVGGSGEQAQSFRAPSGASATARSRPGNEGALAAAGVLVAGTVVLILVTLVAAASFIVLAHRRLRQLGMLAAVGATERHLRLVTLANGAVIGVVAAIAGAIIGIIAWIAVVPGLETAVGHRIASANLPLWLVGAAMLLAVITSTAAAWWPAQTVSRVPIVSALSGRPPQPQPTTRSTALAGPFAVIGLICLLLARNPLDSWINALLIVAGVASLIIGIVLIGPLAIRILAGLGGRSPVAVRLALRDLVRYRARSGSALAAISLTLGIAAAIVITTSAALYASNAEGNLSDTQLLVRIGEIPSSGDVAPISDRTPSEMERLEAVVAQIAGSLGQPAITSVDVAIAPGIGDFEGLPAVVLAKQVEAGRFQILTFLYVASPEILQRYDVALEEVDPETEILTTETGELWFQPVTDEVVRQPGRLDRRHTSVPGSFITPAALRQRGWESARAAWLIETNTPVTDPQFDLARQQAAAVGMTVEVRNDQANLFALRTGAIAIGMLVALGILAMTVGLIRTETAGDLRILTATGATRRIRRTLTATTSGALSLLGALIGTTTAYLALLATSAGDLTPIPLLHLLLVCLGIPLVAWTAGWLLAGKEPAFLARNPID